MRGRTHCAEVCTSGTDPLSADSDGDGVADGKEIHGYEVKVIIPQADGTNKGVTKVLHGDPLTPYRSIDGTLMDTDGDDIPEVVEAWFSKNSICFYSEEFKDMSGASLYDEYSWAIRYFWTGIRGTARSMAVPHVR